MDYTAARFEVLTTPHYSREVREALLSALEAQIGYPPPPELYGDLQEIPSFFGSGAGKVAQPVAPLPEISGRHVIALCLGHARRNDRGARSVTGVFEEEYNAGIIREVSAALIMAGHQVMVYTFYKGGSYGQAMRWLAHKMKDDGVTMAYEFHFNAATPGAEGFEYLHWHKSTRGILAAQAMQDAHDDVFGSWQRNRGVEPLGDQAHERGVLFTSLTHCPAVICEPFFGSNVEEARYFFSEQGRESLVQCYVEGIGNAVAALS